jgi:hypothetical protein
MNLIRDLGLYAFLVFFRLVTEGKDGSGTVGRQQNWFAK